MLVLSRRAQQSIVFPTCGITLHFLSTQGGRIKIGVEAPPAIEIYRGELMAGPFPCRSSIPIPCRSSIPSHNQDLSPNELHAVRNLLNSVNLGLRLCQALLDRGQKDKADAVLNRVLSDIAKLDHGWSECYFNGRSMPASNNACSGSEGAGLVRLLVVEDNENERELLSGLLEMNGCCCQVASDGCEAMEILAKETFDFALIDMHMPRMDGVSLFRKIRNASRFDSMRLLSISSTSPSEAGIGIEERGFDGWLPKPLNPHDLWSHVQSSIGYKVLQK